MMDNRKTVNDMYKYAKEEDSLLLSSFGAANEGFHFWDEYRSKHRKYDKLFNRMFNSFKYFMQEKDTTIAEITEDFTDEVYNHLMINAKKYEELYRVNVIADNDYSITDNYNITETMEKELANNNTDTYGARQDSNTTNIGAKENTDSRNIGAKATTEQNAYGQKQVTNQVTKGAQTDTKTDDIAGFNSANYSNDAQHSYAYGARSDSSSETTNQHSDTKTINEGQHSVTETHNEGQQTVTDTFSKGTYTDRHTGSNTEDYTLTRKGNIGVRTITEVLEYHEQFWTTYEFYTLIFKEICAELLAI